MGLIWPSDVTHCGGCCLFSGGGMMNSVTWFLVFWKTYFSAMFCPVDFGSVSKLVSLNLYLFTFAV